MFLKLRCSRRGSGHHSAVMGLPSSATELFIFPLSCLGWVISTSWKRGLSLGRLGCEAHLLSRGCLLGCPQQTMLHAHGGSFSRALLFVGKLFVGSLFFPWTSTINEPTLLFHSFLSFRIINRIIFEIRTALVRKFHRSTSYHSILHAFWRQTTNL